MEQTFNTITVDASTVGEVSSKIQCEKPANGPDSFAIALLEALDIPTKHCKRATIYLEAGNLPTIDVTYSLTHVPVFSKLGEITKHYSINSGTTDEDQ